VVQKLGLVRSVDVLAITKQGVNWIHKKSVVAKSPPIFHIRVTGSPLTGQLDGIECARCTAPPNAHLAFNGTAEARVVQPRFTGPCEFVFGSHAQKLMPETAQRLKATVGAWCDVYKAGPSGKKTKLSTATRIGQPVDPMPDYSSLADCDLKAKALDIVRQVRNLLTPYYAEERRFQTERMNRMLQGLDAAEDRDVRFFEDSLSSTDRLNDLLDQYRAQFAPNVRAMRAEISKRLHIAPGSGIKPSAAGFGSEASIWTDRLESVANQVPTSTCSR